MQRYFSNRKEDNKFNLNEYSNHIINVMRMKIGNIVEVVYQEKVYICKIISLNPVIVEIIEEKETYNELDIKVTICQSLVKESKMDLILEHGVELGYYSFIPLETRNSIIKLNNNDKDKKVIRWQKIVHDAARQSKRNIVPKVLPVMSLEDIVKLDYDLKILLSVNEMSISLKNVLQNRKKYDKMIIVIGPEGGFKKEEEDYLIKNGFIRTSLGNRVLRTEMASIMALSMINYEYER